MDCPILCGGGGEPVPCPDKRCPLYEEGKGSCQLLSATKKGQSLPEGGEDAASRSEGPAPTGVAVSLSSGDLLSRMEAIESHLSALAARASEATTASLEAGSKSDAELRSLRKSLVNRLDSLEGKVGDLPERLTQLASKVVALVDGLHSDEAGPTAGTPGKDLRAEFQALGLRLDEGWKRSEMRAGDRHGERRQADEAQRVLSNQLAERLADLEQKLSGQLEHVHEMLGRPKDRPSESPAGEGLERIAKEMAERHGRLEAILQGQAERDELRQLERGEEHKREAAERRALADKVEQILGRLSARDEAGEASKEGGSEISRVREQLQRISGSMEWLDAVRDEVQAARKEQREQAQAMGEHFEAMRRDLGTARDASGEASASIQRSLSELAGRVDRVEALSEQLEASHGDAQDVLDALRDRRRLDEEQAKRARCEEANRANSRGVVLFHEGALEAGVDAFARAVDLRSDYAEAHSNLGLALSRLGRAEEAVDSFRRALECDANLPAALNNLGFLYQSQERDADAVEMFRKALQADPAMAPAYVNLGNAYYRMRESSRAVEAWRRALEIDPVNEDAARALRSFDQDPTPGAMN